MVKTEKTEKRPDLLEEKLDSYYIFQGLRFQDSELGKPNALARLTEMGTGVRIELTLNGLSHERNMFLYDVRKTSLEAFKSGDVAKLEQAVNTAGFIKWHEQDGVKTLLITGISDKKMDKDDLPIWLFASGHGPLTRSFVKLRTLRAVKRKEGDKKLTLAAIVATWVHQDVVDGVEERGNVAIPIISFHGPHGDMTYRFNQTRVYTSLSMKKQAQQSQPTTSEVVTAPAPKTGTVTSLKEKVGKAAKEAAVKAAADTIPSLEGMSKQELLDLAAQHEIEIPSTKKRTIATLKSYLVSELKNS